jgi:hypothetical protein
LVRIDWYPVPAGRPEGPTGEPADTNAIFLALFPSWIDQVSRWHPIFIIYVLTNGEWYK